MKEFHGSLEDGKIWSDSERQRKRPKDGQCIKLIRTNNEVRKRHIVLLSENIYKYPLHSVSVGYIGVHLCTI